MEMNHCKKRRQSNGSYFAAMGSSGDLNVDWKQLFLALRDERMTTAEEQLGAFLTESQSLVKSLKTYAAFLQEELDNVKEELHKEKQEKNQLQQRIEAVDTRNCELESARLKLERQNLEQQTITSELNERVQEQERAIWIYRNMTSMHLSNCKEADDENKNDRKVVACDCHVANPATNVSTSFRVSSFHDKVEEANLWFKYDPLANQKHLPEFLHGSIEFEMSQLPSFFQNVIISIFPDEQES